VSPGIAPTLEVSGVSKAFTTVQAVDDVSFAVQRGEIFGLLGPNGAGKTTLIRMMLDIHRPDTGTVRVFGRPLGRSDLDLIGYLPEERGLYRKRTVIQVLSYLARLKGLNGEAAVAVADELLLRLGMEATRTQKLEALSKGNQQKIQLLATLVGRPKLLVWDEPFSGLDPINVRQVGDLLKELNGEGTTVLLSTHLMAQAESLCDRVGLVHEGRLVLCGEVEALKATQGRSTLEEVFIDAVDA
jgi:ABC-2 type transport system ATP-binding protein